MGKEYQSSEEENANFKWEETMPLGLQKHKDTDHNPAHSIELVSNAQAKMEAGDYKNLSLEEISSLGLQQETVDEILQLKNSLEKYDTSPEADDKRAEAAVERMKEEAKREVERQEQEARDRERQEIEKSITKSIGKYISHFYQQYTSLSGKKDFAAKVGFALIGKGKYHADEVGGVYFKGVDSKIRNPIPLSEKYNFSNLSNLEEMAQYITSLSMKGYFTPEEFQNSAMQAKEELDKILEQ